MVRSRLAVAVAVAGATAPAAIAGPFTDRGTQPGLTFPIADPLACSGCHGEVDPAFNYEAYPTWAGSMMAQAARDPLFWAALDVANDDVPGIGDFCLRCHAPRAWLAGRSEPPGGTVDGCSLMGRIDREGDDFGGVGCMTCHRMEINPTPPMGELAVYDENGQFWIDDTDCDGFGEPCRQGPYDYDAEMTSPPFHAWRYSSYHSDSLFCGNCHNVTSPALNLIDGGVDTGIPYPIERTFREWQQSDFAAPGPAAASCQDCHMEQAEAAPAYACSFRVNDRAGNLASHKFAGGNSWILDVLRQEYPALRTDDLIAGRDRAIALLRDRSAQVGLTVPPTIDDGQDLAVAVRVTNLTGHKLPTGYPEGRRMWLNLVVLDGAGAPIYESGAYDAATGDLTRDPAIKVYEVKPGIWDLNGTGACDVVDGSSRPIFHFARNDCYQLDNRIPPLGFTGMSDLETRPVAYVYPETSPGSGILVNYDDTPYTVTVPAGTRAPVIVQATLQYQTTSREYVEFLRDRAVERGFPADCLPREAGLPGVTRGEIMYDLWSRYDRAPPVAMVTTVAGAAILDAACPALPAAVTGLTLVKVGAGRADIELAFAAATGAAAYEAYRVAADAAGTERVHIARANAVGASAGTPVESVAGCSAVTGLACVAPGAVADGTPLAYYQVVGSCDNGSEGPN